MDYDCGRDYLHDKALEQYAWIYDDICWCWNECSYTDCERNLANRLTKGGVFTVALLKGTEMCPLKGE